MSDLYANITETVQYDPDRPGVRTTVYADLHTGDRTVMAAALHAAADRIDPGDPEELADWAEQQAVDRAGLHDAIAAPWREALRAVTQGGGLSAIVAERDRLRGTVAVIAQQLANAGYVTDGNGDDLEQAMYDATADFAQLRVSPLRKIVSGLATQLADAGYVSAGDNTLPGALRDALADLARCREIINRAAVDQPIPDPADPAARRPGPPRSSTAARPRGPA